jgi:hypothetical protein
MAPENGTVGTNEKAENVFLTLYFAGVGTQQGGEDTEFGGNM